MATYQSILEFWFGSHDSAAATAAAQQKLWWGKEAAIDEAMTRRFEPTVLRAAGGELDEWSEAPQSCLALILLTDQFPRNIYRGTAAAFSFDQFALQWCRDGMAREFDLQLDSLQRVFFYLPLEHSEVLRDQSDSVQAFQMLRDTAHESEKALFDGYLDFARRHYEIIARFGRFPHRNAILGRVSTTEEEVFLLKPGSSF